MAVAFDPESPVLVIGAAGVDIAGRVAEQLSPGTSNQSEIHSSFGGTARNVAENLARLGQPVALITAVGKDRTGKQLRNHADRAGIDIQSIVQTKDHPTGAYIAVINQNAALEFALDDMRAIEALTPEVVQDNEERFREASLVFLDANLYPETLNAVITLALKHSLPICADPSSVKLSERLKPYLADLYLITPNSREASIFCDRKLDPADSESGIEAAKFLLSQGLDFAVVTLAEFGVTYATPETSGHIPAIKTKIADPTGGSDALTAALLFALLNEIPPDEAVRLGVTAASLTLRQRGAVLPNLSLELLYEHLVI